jgi:hypothetical protein
MQLRRGALRLYCIVVDPHHVDANLYPDSTYRPDAESGFDLSP